MALLLASEAHWLIRTAKLFERQTPIYRQMTQDLMCRIAARSGQETAPLHGAKPPDALRADLWVSGRPAMREARVPAG